MEHIYTRHDWQTADPTTLVTRLERQLQRLPDTLATTRAGGDAARAEAARAEARIGQPWEHTDRLVGLRRRQKEIDEALAATVAPADDVPPGTPGAPGDGQVLPGAERARRRLDALESRNAQRSAGLSL
ncbi:MAG: hypothetical protein MUF83_22575 [Acidimicrobiales bacterium]|nr:hypothetical protein [Acidimicrobiales bacterium]